MKNAVVMAAFAYGAAMSDSRVPRKLLRWQGETGPFSG